MMLQRDTSGARREAGQSLVEFTLVAMILAMTLAGILDLGRAFFAKIAITDAAGEGAVYAAMRPQCITDTGGACADPNNVRYRVRHASESPLVLWEDVDLTVTAPVIAPGQKITVTVTYQFELLTPFIQSLIGDEWLLIRAQAAQMIQ